MADSVPAIMIRAIDTALMSNNEKIAISSAAPRSVRKCIVFGRFMLFSSTTSMNGFMPANSLVRIDGGCLCRKCGNAHALCLQILAGSLHDQGDVNVVNIRRRLRCALILRKRENGN